MFVSKSLTGVFPPSFPSTTSAAYLDCQLPCLEYVYPLTLIYLVYTIGTLTLLSCITTEHLLLKMLQQSKHNHTFRLGLILPVDRPPVFPYR